MSVEVTVLRVFTDEDENPETHSASLTQAPSRRQIGNGSLVNCATAKQFLWTSPAKGRAPAHAQIFTPAVELPFAGHPTVGVSWWLRERGTPIHTLQVPAGLL
jgi:Phenazine biosynthesis-like protein